MFKMKHLNCLRDTLIDLHNYAAMAVMLIDEKKEECINKISEKDILVMENFG